MKKLSFLSIFFLLFAISSCSSDSEPMDPPSNGVTYTGDVKAIIDANCISCHGDPILNGAPMPLLTSAEVKEAVQNRNLIGRIEDGSMPSGASPDLTAAQIQAVKDWEVDGFN